MILARGRRWPGLITLVTVLGGWSVETLIAGNNGESANEVPTATRIERLREAIEREREALERERETRRAIEEELGRTRDELERTREQLEELEGEVTPDAGAGTQ